MPNDLVDNIFGNNLGEEAAAVETPVVADTGPTTTRPLTGNAARQAAQAAQVEQAQHEKTAMEEVAEILNPTKEEDAEILAPAAESKTPAEPAKVEAKTETSVAKPMMHSIEALRFASANGIGPDEAMNFPTERALVAEATLRKVMSERKSPVEPAAIKPAAPVDELPPPKIELGEDVDPAIKTAVEALAAHTQKVKDWATKQLAARDAELNQIKTEREQAAIRANLSTQAKIAQTFDEETAQWGDEFKELIGKPSESFRTSGQAGEAARQLNDYVVERMLGWEVRNGEPTPEQTVELHKRFINEARYALWPEMAQKSARNEVAKGLKNQKGGIALKPSKARSEAPPAQGDKAALDGVLDYMTANGLNPYVKHRA